LHGGAAVRGHKELSRIPTDLGPNPWTDRSPSWPHDLGPQPHHHQQTPEEEGRALTPRKWLFESRIASLEGYQRSAYMILDADIVAASSFSVYGALKAAD
jgi:hypothetical protein